MASASLDLLVERERSEQGWLLTQYAEQARLTEWLDEAETEDVERIDGPIDPQKPWRYDENWEELGDNEPLVMSNILKCTNPFCSYVEYDGFRVDGRPFISRSFRQLWVEHKALSHLKSPSSSRLLRNRYRDHRKEARKALLIALNAEHQAFKSQMAVWLTEIHTRTELNVLADIAIGHDKRMAALAHREFCDTFAQMCHEFFQAEERIRAQKPRLRPRSVVVDNVHYHPAKLRKGQAVAIATSQSEEDRLIKSGYKVIARAK